MEDDEDYGYKVHNRSFAREIWDDCTLLSRCTFAIPLIILVYMLIFMVIPLNWVMDTIEFSKRPNIFFRSKDINDK